MEQDHLRDADGDGTGVTNDSSTAKMTCIKCHANFTNLSKFNKHYNTHEKPQLCKAKNCFIRFAQKQALDRHMRTEHGDPNPSIYYHCIVDDCKYASTGTRKKKFSRPDQVKEHMKDWGNYGPHSANDRPRRPGKLLDTEHIIPAYFESWTLDRRDMHPQRAVIVCEFNSGALNSCKSRTKLWHLDDVGASFLVGDQAKETGYTCRMAGCYYASPPPKGCSSIAFKTARALKEHYRTAHNSSDPQSTPMGIPMLQTGRDGGYNLEPTDTPNSFSDRILGEPLLGSRPDSTVPAEWHSSEFDLTGFENDGKGQAVEWHNLSLELHGECCSNLDTSIFYDPTAHIEQNDCIAGSTVTCCCVSCSQRYADNSIEKERVLDLNQPEDCFIDIRVEDFDNFDGVSKIMNVYNETIKPLVSPSRECSVDYQYHGHSDKSYSLFNTRDIAMSETTVDKPYTLDTGIDDTTAGSRRSLSKSRTDVLNCEKSFGRRADLQRHLDVQHSSSSFRCTVCARSFRRKDKLREHLKRHKSLTDSNILKGISGISAPIDPSHCSLFDEPSSLYFAEETTPSDTSMTPNTSSVIGAVLLHMGS